MDMNLQQFLLILRARRRIALAILFLVVGLSVAASLLLPKQYTASASVVVDAKSDPVAGAAYQMQQLSAYMPTQMDIVASDRVAQRVVKQLKLDEELQFRQQWQNAGAPGELTTWLSSRLVQALTVTPSRDSSVINISVRWTDAKMAAVLANAFARAYIDTNIELKVDPARQYASWFDERSRALRADVATKQKRLADFQRAKGIVATDDRLDIENARLAELSSQLVAIQAQLQESQSRQHQANGSSAELLEVLQSPLIGALKADLSRAEAKREDVVTRLGTNHPDYQSATAEVEGLRNRIERESAGIATSLSNATQINMRREHDIHAALEAQKARVLELRDQRDAAAVLQNDVLTAQRDLDAVTQRLAQSSLESQTQQTNIVLLTRAVPPVKPSSPKLLRNLILGTFLGAVLGLCTALLLELLDRRIRSDDELLRLLGAPVLGTIASSVSNISASKSMRMRLQPSAG